MLFSDVARGRGRGALAGALAIGLTAAAALAGCSSGSSNSGGSGGGAAGLSGQTLTVYTQAPYGTQLKQYEQYYAYIANAFHKATGSTVKWDYSTSAVSLSQELEQAAATGGGPDVWSIGSSFNGTASALREFYTIPPGDWSSFGGQGAFVSKMLTMSGPDNSHDIGVPFESIPFVLAYNKALFRRAGIGSPPATWSQFVADAAAIREADPATAGAGFSPADPYGPWKPVWSYMEQEGGDFLNKAGTTATLTSAQLQDALKFYFALENTYHVIPKADLTWQGAQETAAFLAGKTGMMMDAAYSLAQEARGTPVASDVGFAPMPNVPYGMSARPAGGQPAESIVSGNYYDVAKYYGNLPLALKFIQVSTAPAAQLEQFKVMGWMPVTQAGVTAVEKTYPQTVPFIQAEQNSTPTDYSPAWSYIETGVLAVIGHIAQQLAGGQSYSTAYALSQLQAENSVVQSHLGANS
ncbi:MAG TPA: extracellular solute-binding protein [Trebonia sp.]|nr:extracellular solute-binding protein [Trebonia sp.]